jgi:hypothetical protein
MKDFVAHLFSLIFHSFHPSEADYLVPEQFRFYGVRLLVRDRIHSSDVLLLAKIFFGMTQKELRRSQFRIAERNGLQSNFSKNKETHNNGLAGRISEYNFGK